eukprot:IDg15066t1
MYAFTMGISRLLHMYWLHTFPAAIGTSVRSTETDCSNLVCVGDEDGVDSNVDAEVNCADYDAAIPSSADSMPTLDFKPLHMLGC